MKLLITGGYGFIGSNLLRHLYETYPDYTLWNLDALTYAGNLNNLEDIRQKEASLPAEQKRTHFVHGNICDPVLVENLLSEHRFDAILNLAAESHVDRSIMGAGDFVKTNIQGVHVLLEAARKHKVPRFVQISTDEVYGDQESNDSPTREDAPLRPSNPYSSSKASADLIIQAYMRTFQFPALIVRPSNNFGAYQYPEKLIPLTITNFLENSKTPLHGDGQQIRSWLFVKDCCRAIDLLLHRGELNEIYNVAGTLKKNIEVIEAIATHLHKNADDSTTHISDRPGQDKKYMPDGRKIQKIYGWKAEHTFEEALQQVVQWYIDHPAWWQELRNNDVFKAHYTKQANGKWF